MSTRYMKNTCLRRGYTMLQQRLTLLRIIIPDKLVGITIIIIIIVVGKKAGGRTRTP